MKKIKQIISLVMALFVVLISCTSNSQIKLKDDTYVVQIFNQEEISSLSMIVGFFDSLIVKNTGNQGVNQEYRRYFNAVSESESFEDLRTHIGLASSIDIIKLIKQLKEEGIFNEIWNYEYGYDYKTKDTVSIRLTLNMQGKYFKLLESLGTKNDYLKEYVNTVQTSGCIPPSLIAGVMKTFYRDIDFQREVYRLVWAIHYITILSEKKYERGEEIENH